MTRRSGTTAYGLESGTEGWDWRLQAACRDYDPDLWGSTEWSERGQAVWVCEQECPVRSVCYRWADEHRDMVDQMIFGGVYWSRGSNEEGASRNRSPRPALQQPTPVPPTGNPARRRRPEIRVPRAPSSVPTIGPQCGTRSGGPAHRRRSEPSCQACKDVEKVAWQAWARMKKKAAS